MDLKKLSSQRLLLGFAALLGAAALAVGCGSPGSDSNDDAPETGTAQKEQPARTDGGDRAGNPAAGEAPAAAKSALAALRTAGAKVSGGVPYDLEPDSTGARRAGRSRWRSTTAGRTSWT